MQNLPWCATFPGSPGGAAICCRAKMRAPHLAWAHLPYRRVDIGNLAKSREGQRAAGSGKGAARITNACLQLRVFCIAFSICTLHAFIALRFRRKTLDRSLGPRAKHSYRCNCFCFLLLLFLLWLLLPFSDHTLEREAIISEMQLECLTEAVS